MTDDQQWVAVMTDASIDEDVEIPEPTEEEIRIFRKNAKFHSILAAKCKGIDCESCEAKEKQKCIENGFFGDELARMFADPEIVLESQVDLDDENNEEV